MSNSRMPGTLPDFERFFFCNLYKEILRESEVQEQGLMEQWYDDPMNRDHYFLYVHQQYPRNLNTTYEIIEELDTEAYRRTRTINVIDRKVIDKFDTDSDRPPVVRRYWQLIYKQCAMTMFEYIFPRGLITVRIELTDNDDIKNYAHILPDLSSQYRGHLAWQIYRYAPMLQCVVEQKTEHIDNNDVQAYVAYIDINNVHMPDVNRNHDYNSPLSPDGEGQGPIIDITYPDPDDPNQGGQGDKDRWPVIFGDINIATSLGQIHEAFLDYETNDLWYLDADGTTLIPITSPIKDLVLRLSQEQATEIPNMNNMIVTTRDNLLNMLQQVNANIRADLTTRIWRTTIPCNPSVWASLSGVSGQAPFYTRVWLHDMKEKYICKLYLENNGSTAAARSNLRREYGKIKYLETLEDGYIRFVCDVAIPTMNIPVRIEVDNAWV